jgi:hypothetical protein
MIECDLEARHYWIRAEEIGDLLIEVRVLTSQPIHVLTPDIALSTAHGG